MNERRKHCAGPCAVFAVRLAAIALLLSSAARCQRAGPASTHPTKTVLRVGVGQIELSQFIQNVTIESLAKVQEDGRLKPWLAESWTLSPDGLSLAIQLRRNVRFQDGSPLVAADVVQILKTSLPKVLGAGFDDISDIAARDDARIEIGLKRRSTFVQEATFETPIEKPGKPGLGTGPFIADTKTDGATSSSMHANVDYFLGRPNVDQIVINTYASSRSAWAELLRNNVDMVYEVGSDAFDSLANATAVHVYSFVRRYQYEIMFNVGVPALKSAAVRRALNAAVDRQAFVRDALSTRGVASTGPVWPKHWAFNSEAPDLAYDPQAAIGGLASHPANSQRRMTFTCLVAPDATRLALVVKQQLERVGVDMNVEEAPLSELNEAARQGKFEAVLAPFISGPTLLRPYLWWHTAGPFNRGGYSNRDVDAALDTVGHAKSDDEYRQGVIDFQRAVLADPPAIFLAWDELARAVNNRFEVPVDPGLDILGSLRLWRPVGSRAGADKN